MSVGNVEIVRRALAAFERQGVRDIEALIPYVTEDVELRSAIIGGAEGNVYRGHDGIRRWAAEGAELFDELRLVADDERAVSAFVVALGFIHARGGASGLTLDSPTEWVITVRDGLIARLSGYLDHE
jgi:ketosteroid isomerase-like protein